MDINISADLMEAFRTIIKSVVRQTIEEMDLVPREVPKSVVKVSATKMWEIAQAEDKEKLDAKLRLQDLYSSEIGKLVEITGVRAEGTTFCNKPAYQMEFKFENGFGASVVCHSGSHGSREGLLELAVLGSKGGIVYHTDITSDVLGHLTAQEAYNILEKIKLLDKKGKLPK
jgi:hypothetical protein